MPRTLLQPFARNTCEAYCNVLARLLPRQLGRIALEQQPIDACRHIVVRKRNIIGGVAATATIPADPVVVGASVAVPLLQ